MTAGRRGPVSVCEPDYHRDRVPCPPVEGICHEAFPVQNRTQTPAVAPVTIGVIWTLE